MESMQNRFFFVKILKYLISSLLIFFIYTCKNTSYSSDIYNTKDTNVIDNIYSWKHPTKEVFQKYNVILRKVEFFQNRVYPVFHAEFPWDPQTSPNAKILSEFEIDLFLANGKHDYAIQDESDGIRIEVTWDKGKRVLREDIVFLGNSPHPVVPPGK